MENAELIKSLKEDAEWAHANEWETPITLGNHLDAAADALEMADAKMHEQDLRIADLVAHLNAEQAKVARLVAENEELKRRLDENIGASKLWNQKYYNLAAEKLDTTYAHICDLLAASQRRERAAVEDLKRFSACCQCNANIDGSCCDMFDGTAENKYFCSNWQWRGSQEAEEGEME